MWGLGVVIALLCHRNVLSILTRQRCRTVAVHVGVMATYTRHEGAIGGIMEILGLLAYTVHAIVGKTALHTPRAGSFVACCIQSQFNHDHNH